MNNDDISKRYKVCAYEEAKSGQAKLTLWDRVEKKFRIGKFSIFSVIGIPGKGQSKPRKAKPVAGSGSPSPQGEPAPVGRSLDPRAFVPSNPERFR